MSGLKVILPMAAVILVIFGVLLLVLFFTGTGEKSGATPTPSRTAVMTLPASPTPFGASWKPVTPQPASKIGRSDCPANWVAYADPQARVSICYPADSRVTAGDFAANISTPGHDASVNVSWNARPHTIYYPPSPENCPNDTNIVEGPATSTFTQIQLASGTVPACLVMGRLGGDLHADVPLARDGSGGDGYVQWFVGFLSTTGVPAIGQEIIRTLSVDYR